MSGPKRVTSLTEWLIRRHPSVIASIAERCARNAGLEAERLANAQHCLAVADAIADSEARWYDAHAEVEP